MGEGQGEPEERPATWENVVVGEAKELLGHAIRDKELVDEGEDQVEIAHEVHEEYEDEPDND
jgi:uncharacterized protein YjbJ (UPF0337 family)